MSNVEKDEIVKFNGCDNNNQYRALHSFNVKDVLERYSAGTRYLESSMTKGLDQIFMEQFTDHLINNLYIEVIPNPVKVFSLSVNLQSSPPSFSMEHIDEDGDRIEAEIKLQTIITEQTKYTESCEWSISYSQD